MALQSQTTIKIGETIIDNFSDLEIVQEIHKHHTFSLQIRQDLLVSEFKSVMPISQQLIGKKISIEVKPIEQLDDLMVISNPKHYVLQFYGYVTQVSMAKSVIRNTEETILIEGKSTSVLLDGAPNCNSFYKLSLDEIVSKVKAGYDIDLDINAFYKNNIPYTVQYNESDFDFLNRLAKRNGQWFFNNGRINVFGGPASTPIEPLLKYGVNMYDFSYSMKVMPTLFKTIENDNREGKCFENKGMDYSKEADGFHQNFISKSAKVFSKESLIQLNQNTTEGWGKSTSEEYTKNKMRGTVSELMQVEAMSEVPGVTLGNNVIIRGIDMQLESSYRVTKVTHYCDDGGSYENSFVAVNFNGAVFSPYTNPDLFPRCGSQTAKVTDTHDPEGLSGVRVQMTWQEILGEKTPFIPMLQQYGGSGKGFHILPEIGETVFVDFQGGNAELPIITGTVTNNKETSGFATTNNDLKVMRTRSGITTIYNDAEGSISIEDAGGSKCFLDGKGNIQLSATKNVTIDAGGDLILNAGNSITIDAGKNIDEKAGGYKTSNIGLFYNLEVGANYFMNVLGTLFENIVGNRETEAGEIKESAKEVLMHSSEKDIKLRSSKNVNSHSGENSNNG